MFHKHTILGVHLTDRLTEAVEVQRLLSQYGQQIRTRLGLHDVESTGESSPSGLLVLEMVGDDKGIEELSDKLNAINGVEVKSMVFEHPQG